MSKKLCKLVSAIDNGVNLTINRTSIQIKNDATFNSYCPTTENGNKEECDSIILLVNSAIIKMVKMIKDFVSEDALESGKLTQYTILWLCYKLNLMSYEGIKNINDFHNKYIKGNESAIQKLVDVEAYNIYKDLINKNGDFMNMDIEIMSKFYESLKILCKLYNEFDDENPDCTVCSKKLNEFDIKFETLNNDSSITGNETYSQLLDTLSNDYGNLKNKCKCSLSLPTREQMQPTPQGSEATSSGSSVASKLIPALLVFAIPFFLGIAYKYSLFGFGKRSQKEYLKKRLKK
ncbi:Plasmodium variant antigen protein Cir/Yir/Bir, putative [Plasmodium chabaudi chabaudi]|uniref:Plasmodium variant antigen protein Cir/Yir/Bir, putative n=1 Tax=Plasmodium chabaudi chabaudi TaxID=31271 RepID=A0A1D3L815_PLACU|nr:Plasmodium variant antigen protein Cir/Yir/Bir, putative [Plasmodium chabaudi chabaudi]